MCQTEDFPFKASLRGYAADNTDYSELASIRYSNLPVPVMSEMASIKPHSITLSGQPHHVYRDVYPTLLSLLHLPRPLAQDAQCPATASFFLPGAPHW